MQNLFFKFTICQTFLLWKGHMKFKSSIMVGHLNLNRSILKSSNAQGLLAKRGVLKFRSDWHRRSEGVYAIAKQHLPLPLWEYYYIIKCSGQEHRAIYCLKENSFASYFFSLFNYQLRVIILYRNLFRLLFF